MLLSMSGEPKAQEANNSTNEAQRKCRIPQRLPPGRLRPLPKAKLQYVEKNKAEVVSMYQPRFGAGKVRFGLGETRPKSASRATESVDTRHRAPVCPRSAKTDRDSLSPTFKKPMSPPFKKNITDKLFGVPPNRPGRHAVTVPLVQKPSFFQKSSTLPDQETIKRCEEYELKQEEFSDAGQIYDDMFTDFTENESITSKGDQIVRLKMNWKEKVFQFEKMKEELNDQQATVMKAYATLRDTHGKLTELGQKTSLPLMDELRIMNVAQMTPNQLLQLCAETKTLNDDNNQLAKSYLNIDIARLDSMPSKLVATCEQTLAKRKDFINWFENLKNHEKECSKSTLTRKINEFNAENDMLNSTLQSVKSEFLRDLNEITGFVRKCVNQTIALTLRNEDLTCEVSELHSQNTDLRKQIYNAEQLKSHHNRVRIEEIEKELKEEKFKKMAMKDRMTRAEGQVKIGEERASRLEAALDQSHAQVRNLERTIQQLNDQNQRLQTDFDEELNKLKESINENTTHLEEIASARQKLQTEKEDLEKRLEELSNHYNESICNMKHEMNVNVSKMIDSEKRLNEEVQEKKKLQTTVEAQCARLLESELHYKDTLLHLHETESKLCKAMNDLHELEIVKVELKKAKAVIEEHKTRLLEQNNLLEDLKNNLKQSQTLEEQLRLDINSKKMYIEELEKKQCDFERQIKDSDSKMQVYEEQLTSIKHHIKKLQEHFGEFESLNELHELINVKNSKVQEMSQQNEELSQQLQKKSADLDNYIKVIAEHEHLINQRDVMINMLSEKDEEQLNIIKLLRNNLEIRAQADSDINQQLTEKDAEIKSLVANLETRKRQICQLEKIILTLDDQSRTVHLQRNKDQEKINALEKRLVEFEQCLESKNGDEPVDNLDNLIKILENEMGSNVNPLSYSKDFNSNNFNKKIIGDHKQICQDFNRKSPNYLKETVNFPTKIVLGNFVKKTYISNNKERPDCPDHKQGLTNIINQKYAHKGNELHESEQTKSGHNLSLDKDINSKSKGMYQKKLPHDSNKVLYDKKFKMFQLASHRLA